MKLKWLYNNKLKYNSEKKHRQKIVKEKTTYVAVFPLPPFPIKLLKGPKHEIFESGFFTQIRGLWLGDLGTGEKN
jgi:hypothetical protein